MDDEKRNLGQDAQASMPPNMPNLDLIAMVQRARMEHDASLLHGYGMGATLDQS